VLHARERNTLNTVIRRAREREMRNAITCEDLRDGRGNLRHVERGKERGDEDLELVGLLGELTSQLAGAHTANEALRDSHAIELSRKHEELATARREAAERRTVLERSQSQRGESRAESTRCGWSSSGPRASVTRCAPRRGLTRCGSRESATHCFAPRRVATHCGRSSSTPRASVPRYFACRRARARRWQ